MAPPKVHPRRHLLLVVAFKFVAWLLVLVSALSIAVLVQWLSAQTDQPRPTSAAIHVAGWLSILLNLLLIYVALDGLQRSLDSGGKFATSACLVTLAAAVTAEALQVYFFHSVTRPHQLHSFGGTGEWHRCRQANLTRLLYCSATGSSGESGFTDWLHWAAVAFAGPICKAVLICAYRHFAESQDHFIEARLSVRAQ